MPRWGRPRGQGDRSCRWAPGSRPSHPIVLRHDAGDGTLGVVMGDPKVRHGAWGNRVVESDAAGDSPLRHGVRLNVVVQQNVEKLRVTHVAVELRVNRVFLCDDGAM